MKFNDPIYTKKKHLLRHCYVIFTSSFYSLGGKYLRAATPSDTSLLLEMKQRKQQNLI